MPEGHLSTTDKIEGFEGKHDVLKGEALQNIVCPFIKHESVMNKCPKGIYPRQTKLKGLKGNTMF